MSTTELFSNASSFSIQGSSFVVVRGDQVNNHIYRRDRKNQEVSEYDERQVYGPKRKRAETLKAPYQNYQTISIGDLYLLQEVAAMSEVIRMRDDGPKQVVTVARRNNMDTFGDAVQVTRSVSIAEIVPWLPSPSFTAVVYEGPGAQIAWQRDFDYFSRLKHHTIAQIFGLNRSAIPALIFHSALIPLDTFLACSSSIALCYLQYRWVVDRGEAFRKLDRVILNEELWMQDRSGLLCVGPVGPPVMDQVDALVPEWHSWHKGPLNLRLPFRHYESDYLILDHIQKHHGGLHDFVSQYGVFMVPLTPSRDSSYTLCSIYDQSRRESAAYFVPLSSFSIYPWHTQKATFQMCQLCTTVIDNGWTRVSFTEQISPGSFQLTYSIKLLESNGENLRAAWLSQASYIKRALGRGLSDYVLLDSIHFSISCSFSKQTDLSRPVYLFISPVISDTLLTTTTVTEPLCYWSFDPDGWQEEEEELAGYPKPILQVTGGSRWRHFQYDAIRQYQIYQEFDPYTQAYAMAHGYPLLQLATGIDRKRTAGLESASFHEY